MEIAGSTIVVTGGRGFLGRHVVDQLEKASAHVIALGRNDYDLRQRAEADRLLSDTRPHAVVHLAAVVGGIGANRAEPGRFLYENAIMGLELIEACRVAGTEKVLVAGTVCAYPKFTPVPFKEEHLWDGFPDETNAPYGLAKKLLLVQAQAYREQYGMKVVYLLPVNLYGPHDNFDLETGHVIPSMIAKFLDARDRKDASTELWGDGTPTREFLFVRDAGLAFRLALEHYDDADPVNIGSGTEISIRDLAATIADACSYRGEICWDESKPNGQPRRRLDTALAMERFGFVAETSFETGIAETVKWFEDQRRRSR